VTDWPEATTTYAKVPTAALFQGKEMKHWGYQAQKYQAEKEQKLKNDDLFYSSRFKLHLAERSADLDLPRLPPGNKVVDVFASFLRGMVKDSVVPKMIEAFGEFDISTVRWCLTVPAIWSNEAKNTMKRAAVQAGLFVPCLGSLTPPGLVRGPRTSVGSVHPTEVVLEPEAALLYVLWDLNRKQKALNKTIDRF
jgi:hypothetical protein